MRQFPFVLVKVLFQYLLFDEPVQRHWLQPHNCVSVCCLHTDLQIGLGSYDIVALKKSKFVNIKNLQQFPFVLDIVWFQQFIFDEYAF
jgi:hypothetical protein